MIFRSEEGAEDVEDNPSFRSRTLRDWNGRKDYLLRRLCRLGGMK